MLSRCCQVKTGIQAPNRGTMFFASLPGPSKNPGKTHINGRKSTGTVENELKKAPPVFAEAIKIMQDHFDELQYTELLVALEELADVLRNGGEMSLQEAQTD